MEILIEADTKERAADVRQVVVAMAAQATERVIAPLARAAVQVHGNILRNFLHPRAQLRQRDVMGADEMALGVMGVVLCLVLLIPGNMLIHHLAGNANVVAALPPLGALILIVLATLLTMLGGLIPARSAAKSNPVKALRSE